VYSPCITIQIRDTQHKFTCWLRTLAGPDADTNAKDETRFRVQMTKLYAKQKIMPREID
jgi:hypothetical protein